MTLNGFFSRVRMIPRLIRILWRSFLTGTYVRPEKYMKYQGRFQAMLSQRDVSRGMTVTNEECYTLYSSVLATRHLSGAIAEVGVYKGNTAKIICEVKESKQLILFDTFAGMPNSKISNKDEWEKNTHRDTSLESVQAYLRSYDSLLFVPGEFPESVAQSQHREFIEGQKFCFVNIDVDLYQSTLDCLNFFYPRLVSGGRLVSHNYNIKGSPGGNTPGVKDAFFEFFEGREEKIIEIAETQCMILKQG